MPLEGIDPDLSETCENLPPRQQQADPPKGHGEEDGLYPSSWPDSPGPLHGALNAHGATGTRCHAIEFGEGGGGALRRDVLAIPAGILRCEWPTICSVVMHRPPE